jgi:hypothetical protein
MQLATARNVAIRSNVPPKNPKTAYVFFCQDKRDEVRAGMPSDAKVERHQIKNAHT